jgi:hypothetical protein
VNANFAVPVVLVTDVQPHPEIDTWDIVTAGDHRAIGRKGQFLVGDGALYIPPGARMPDGFVTLTTADALLGADIGIAVPLGTVMDVVDQNLDRYRAMFPDKVDGPDGPGAILEGGQDLAAFLDITQG